MRRVVLLYNPQSGSGHSSRTQLVTKIAIALRERGWDVQIVATTGPRSAIVQTRECCKHDAPEIVFACGGDGTVHEVLQGLVFSEKTALGVIPLGSANVFAKHLRLPHDPLKAALAQLARAPKRTHIGRVTFLNAGFEEARYFLVVAGAGPDGALVYRMLASGKHRFGAVLYALRAAKLFLTSSFHPFHLTIDRETSQAISVMALRVQDLGGIFRPLMRGAHHDDEDLLLSCVRAPAKPSLLAWFALSWARLHALNPTAKIQRADRVMCGAGITGSVHVEADGESLGITPMTLEVIKDAVLILPPI